MNFSGVSRAGVVGRLLRSPLKLIPASARLPIVQGPLRGWWWVVGSGSHGYWLGSYEQEKSRLFADGIRPGDVVYDVGANVGYYTLLAASAVGEQGRVIAFEPLPENLAFLRRHLSMNHLQNVEVFAAAVSDRAGETFFEVAASRSMGQISKRGSLTMRVVALDELVAAGTVPPPDCIKIDVEGAEGQVLAGARKVLTDSKPDIHLALHGAEAREACCRVLSETGYRLSAADEQSAAEEGEIYATQRR